MRQAACGVTRILAVALAAAVAVAAALLGGCGTSQSRLPGDKIGGHLLTVYVSVPLNGDASSDGQAIINAAQLALAQVHGRIGKYRVALRTLNDASPQRRSWDPGQTAENARAASLDRTAIGYLGEFNSGATAISIPVLNRVGIPQISPASTAVGLTSAGAGAAPGEPQKYYPTGVRTFLRVVPNDVVQARAQVELQQRLGCRKTYVVDDGEVDGADLADSFELVARSAGLNVVGVQAFEPGTVNYAPFAASVAQSGADCVMISAITDSGAAAVTRQLAAAMPKARLFGTAGVAQTAFVDPAEGGLPFGLDPRILITSPSLPEQADPAERGFDLAYTRQFGSPPPSAAFGYEAMSLLLNAISRATGRGNHSARRSKVNSELFATHDRHSILGTYSIDSSGDISLRRYGVYRVLDGTLRYWGAIRG